MIELFICLALLTIMGGLVLFKSKGMVQDFRFQKQVSGLKREVIFTKRLAQSYNADIVFTIRQSDTGIQWIRTSDEPMNHLKNHFNRLHRTSVIQTFTYQGARVNELSILFSGSGLITPLGSIQVKYNDHKETIKWD